MITRFSKEANKLPTAENRPIEEWMKSSKLAGIRDNDPTSGNMPVFKSEDSEYKNLNPDTDFWQFDPKWVPNVNMKAWVNVKVSTKREKIDGSIQSFVWNYDPEFFGGKTIKKRRRRNRPTRRK